MVYIPVVPLAAKEYAPVPIVNLVVGVAPTPKFPDESIVVEPAALTVLDALTVVNAPVFGVVAPTVPLYPEVALNDPTTASPVELNVPTVVEVLA